MPTVDHIDESALQPIRCTDLSRLGSPHDGGYVVSVRALRRASTLVSLGLSVDWNFERAALALNPGLTIHAYDHTVGPRLFAKSALLSALVLPFRLITLNPRRVKTTLRKIGRSLDYFRFFRGAVRHFQQRVWFNSDDGSVDMATIIARTQAPAEHSIFAKIDIEGSEYRIIPTIAEHARLFSGLAIEFHDTDVCAATFNAQIALLRRDFEIVHVHGNNYGGLSLDRRLPLTWELSFLHKDLLDEPVRPYSGPLPRVGLDAPNDPSRPDYRLHLRLDNRMRDE